MSNQKQRTRAEGRVRTNNIIAGAVGTVINIVLVVVAAMLVYKYAIAAYQYGVRIFGEPAMDVAPGTAVVVEVTDGMDFDGIAQTLYENGLIRDKKLFRLQELLSNYAKEGFTEGTYTLTTAMTADEMMDVMAGDGEDS